MILKMGKMGIQTRFYLVNLLESFTYPFYPFINKTVLLEEKSIFDKKKVYPFPYTNYVGAKKGLKMGKAIISIV